MQVMASCRFRFLSILKFMAPAGAREDHVRCDSRENDRALYAFSQYGLTPRKVSAVPIVPRSATPMSVPTASRARR